MDNDLKEHISREVYLQFINNKNSNLEKLNDKLSDKVQDKIEIMNIKITILLGMIPVLWLFTMIIMAPVKH